MKMYLLSLIAFFVVITAIVFSGVSLSVNMILINPVIRWIGASILATGYILRLLAWHKTKVYEIRDYFGREAPSGGIYRYAPSKALGIFPDVYRFLSLGLCSVVGSCSYIFGCFADNAISYKNLRIF